MKEQTLAPLHQKYSSMKIVVYCSATDNLPDNWQEGARLTGRWIGSHKASLVYGGVDSGLMQIVAHATKDAGGDIIGIVPARRLHKASPLNDLLIRTSALNDRKSVMQMLGDVFVVLPGGYGTLDELSTSFAYLNFTRQRRPIIIYNPDHIFDPVLTQYTRMAELGLMSSDALGLITVTTTPEELEKALDNTLSHA